MSNRDDDREALKNFGPDSWTGRGAARYGDEFILDYFSLMDVIFTLGEINLSRRPYAGNPELKTSVRVARAQARALHEDMRQLVWKASHDEEA